MSEDNERIDGTYIYFFKPDRQNPKTEIWNIFSKEGNFFLGEIRWYGPWRKYSLVIDCLYLKDKLIFESRCLSEIVTFLNRLMEQRKTKRKAEVLKQESQ